MSTDTPPNLLRVGVVQCALGRESRSENVDEVTRLVRMAAELGAQIILPPELFEGAYFCQEERPEFFDFAHPMDNHPTVKRMQALAAELGVVIPVSVFEQDKQSYYNTVAMVDADGAVLGTYRKSHIPDGPGYEEKFFFRPGNTGMKVWDTRHGRVGVGICWDQWFPECARAMALAGAELLLYPTAIGSEPEEPELDSCDPWRRVMIGHAVANAMPVAAANRVGLEGQQRFFGSSFICDQRGDLHVDLDRDETGVGMAVFDRDELRRYRANWGFFRDRRPELYGSLTE
ncbi:MAG: N-carbamoylputrescine amidase [Sandaracinaceae bacterium]|nr:N-carbamoylputrescine amidase [Sandaracinaceae bacterium]